MTRRQSRSRTSSKARRRRSRSSSKRREKVTSLNRHFGALRFYDQNYDTDVLSDHDPFAFTLGGFRYVVWNVMMEYKEQPTTQKFNNTHNESVTQLNTRCGNIAKVLDALHTEDPKTTFILQECTNTHIDKLKARFATKAKVLHTVIDGHCRCIITSRKAEDMAIATLSPCNGVRSFRHQILKVGESTDTLIVVNVHVQLPPKAFNDHNSRTKSIINYLDDSNTWSTFAAETNPQTNFLVVGDFNTIIESNLHGLATPLSVLTGGYSNGNNGASHKVDYAILIRSPLLKMEPQRVNMPTAITAEPVINSDIGLVLRPTPTSNPGSITLSRPAEPVKYVLPKIKNREIGLVLRPTPTSNPGSITLSRPGESPATVGVNEPWQQTTDLPQKGQNNEMYVKITNRDNTKSGWVNVKYLRNSPTDFPR